MYRVVFLDLYEPFLWKEGELLIYLSNSAAPHLPSLETYWLPNVLTWNSVPVHAYVHTS